MSSIRSSVDLFFCYAREDEQWREKLEKHLSPLIRLGFITGWHDRKILPGLDWAHEIDARLSASKIILLLISADFIASDYCYSHEMRQALAKHEKREASVIPVIVRPVIWKDAPFGRLQALPTNAKPISTWVHEDEGLVDVVQSVERIVKEMAQPVNARLTTLPSFFHQEKKRGKAVSQQFLSSQARTLYPQSASEGGNTEDWKQTLRRIQEQMSEINLRNMYERDIRLVKKKLGEINKKIKDIKDEHIIKDSFHSVEIVCLDIQNAIAECDVILVLFAKLLVLLDRLRTKHADVSEMAKGVDEFYRSLERCQRCLDEAFQHILP